MVRDGMPLGSIDDAEAWRVGKYGFAPASPPAGAPSGDTNREDLAGTLARAVSAEMEAWRALQAATNDEAATPVARMAALKHYHAAASLRVTTEETLAKIRVESGQLVTMQAAKDAIAKVLDPLRVLLRAMPRSVAGRANPSDPELARMAVEEAVEQVMAQVGGKG
jgi:hypothetical protein